MQAITDAVLHAPPDLHGAGLGVAVALAEWAVWIGPMLLACLWLAGAPEDRAAAVAAGAAAALGLVIAAAIYPRVGEPRPFVDGHAPNLLHHAPDGGFPSDHATLAFSLAFGLLLRRPPRLPRAWLALLAVAVAVGWARVYLGAHHPIDILGGAAVGLASARATLARIGRAPLSRLVRLGEVGRSRAPALSRVSWGHPRDPARSDEETKQDRVDGSTRSCSARSRTG